MDRLKGIFVAAAIIMGGLFAWFTSNFFYTLIWAYLDKWKFKEADVIAYTLANLTPFVLIILLSAIFYFFVRREMARQITLSPARLREIEAQENHAEQLRRHAAALEDERLANSPIQLALKRAFDPKPLAPSEPRDPPESIAATYDRDVSLYDAICRMFLGRWEKILIKDGHLDLSQNGFQAIHDLMDHIRQLAFDDRLPIWGKKQGHQSLWEKPVPVFWKNNHLDYLSFTDGDAMKLRVVPSNTGGQTTSLRDLMTSRHAVDAICEDQSIASTLPTNDANSLCIITGTGEPFDHVEVNQHGVHHTISVGIKNVGSRKITNCNFYRTYVGFTGDSQKVFLDGPFSLDPNEIRYLSIAMFNETKDLPHANHLIGLSLSPGAFGAGIMVPQLPPDRRHVLSFVAESVDTGNAVLHCELLVNEAGKLRLEIL